MVLAQTLRRLAYKLGPRRKLAAAPDPVCLLRLFCDLQRQLVELLLVHRRRRACQWVCLARSLRKRDYLSDAVAVSQHRDYAVDAEGNSAVRRGAVLEGVEEEAEALLGLVLGDAECPEDLLLHVGAVDTDRAAADLPAVPDHVVGAASPAPGVAVEVAGGARERVVQSVPARLVLAPLEHREVDDPEKVVTIRRRRQLEPQRAEHARGDRRGVGHDQDRVALARAELGVDRGHLLGLQELGDRRAPCALALHYGPDEALGAELLGLLGELVEALAREVGARRRQAAHHAA